MPLIPISLYRSEGSGGSSTVVPDASNTVKGIIRIATDGEVTTGTSEVLAVNPKQLKDGLDSVSRGSNIPFSIKSANIGDKGEVDLFNVSKFVNSGCSFTGSVATGGSGKYVRLLETAPLASANSWEFKTKYTYASGGAAGKQILGSSTSFGCQVPRLIVGEGGGDKIRLFVSTNGSSWNLFNQDLDLTMSLGVTYYIKLSYSSTTGYKFEYSEDGVSYTTSWTSATTTKCFCGTPFVFLNNMSDLTYYYSSGGMDLSLTAFTIDGSVWWNGADLSNSLTFKVDDGTSYAPLKVVNPSGTEVTLTSISALDLSLFSDGIINIFATATGAEARQNNIYMRTEEPVAENGGDIWINGDVIKDWDETGSVWVATTVVAFLGSIIKNGLIENGYCFPLNYNGKSEMSCFNYVSGNLEIDIIAKSGFKFFGRYKNYLLGAIGTARYPIPFFAFYNTSYSGIYTGGQNGSDNTSSVSSVTRDIFGYFAQGNVLGYVTVQGYITI